MTRPLRLILLISAAAAAGVTAGLLMRVGSALVPGITEHPEAVPRMPGQSLPTPPTNWTQPDPASEEGRLIAEIRERPRLYGQDKLLGLLVHRHPAVRDEVVRQLGLRLKGSGDALAIRALESRLESERDPIVRTSAKQALEALKAGG